MSIPDGYVLDGEFTHPDAIHRDRFPLSFAQHRLWHLMQIEGTGEAFHIPFGLRLKGDLNRTALFQALDRIVARHEILRTTFPSFDGEPVQQVDPLEDCTFHLIDNDLRLQVNTDKELDRLVEFEANAPVDSESGPLIRGRLIRLSECDHLLLITMHNLISDGWSKGVLAKELGMLYGAFQRSEDDLPPEPDLQYAEYSVVQRYWMECEIMQGQAAYWKVALAGALALTQLPTEHHRSYPRDHRGDFVQLELDEPLSSKLKALSARHNVHIPVTMLAAWAAFLGRLSSQQDVVIGMPAASRGRSEIKNLVGLFENLLAVRVDLSASPTVGQLLKRVMAQVHAAEQRQDIPFEQVLEIVQPKGSLAQTQLFQTLFTWQNEAEPSLEFPGLEAHFLPMRHRVAKFDLTLSLWEKDETIVGGLEYAASLFGKATIVRLLAHFHNLLQAMVADDEIFVDRLPTLAESEWQCESSVCRGEESWA